MHVLVAAHDFHPDPGSGGTGRYVYETMRRFVARGHEVSVITRRRSDLPEHEVIAGIDVYRYEVPLAGRSAPEILRRLPGAATTVSRYLDDVRPVDVASFQGPVTALLVDRLLDDGVPRIPTFHSPWPVEYRLRTRGVEGADGFRRRLNVAFRRALEKRTLSRASALVTLSEFMRETLQRVYGAVAETTVIPGGVDTRRFTPDGRVHDAVDGDPAFLTVRRLSERMGHELLLEAFATVLEQRPGARLSIAGAGPLRDHLESTARAFGVRAETQFLGYVPDEELPSVYRAADVFVLPTRDLEGFGLATLEALSSGLPVVATPVGGTVEIISGLEEIVERPMLVSTPDAAGLADGMLTWTGRPDDDSTTVGRTCRQYVRRRYTWEATVDRLEALYETRVSGPSPVGRSSRSQTKSE